MLGVQYFVVVYTCWIKVPLVDCTNGISLYGNVHVRNPCLKHVFMGGVGDNESLVLIALCVCIHLTTVCFLPHCLPLAPLSVK